MKSLILAVQSCLMAQFLIDTPQGVSEIMRGISS